MSSARANHTLSSKGSRSTHTTVVLIDVDATNVAAFRDAALQESGTRVILAHTWLEGVAQVRIEHPELVVAGRGLDPVNAVALCREVHEAAGEHTLELAAIVDGRLPDNPAWPWTAAVALPDPIAVAHARALIRSAGAMRATRSALADARVEVQRVSATLEGRQEALVELLLRIVDLRLPGARDRAAWRSGLASDLCERLGIPGELRHDLGIAVRLQELGYLAVPGRDPWHAVQSARAILDTIPGFEGAAGLLGDQCENWDGTGNPGHRLQGQIPLRARILRVVLDYTDALAVPGATSADSEAVLHHMAERAGTWYDPMVMVHLRAIPSESDAGDWHHNRVTMPVEELRVGMVLAEDLYADSGIKLLSQGTTIVSATLETILRRHHADPLLHGAVVLRRSA